jgi:hypothetical protein
MRSAYALLALLLLAACGDWKQDPAALTARSGPAPGLECAACHNYPPQDSNHLYHLNVAGGNKYANGPITCLDCHRASLQWRVETLLDTFFIDPDPTNLNRQSSVDWPVRSPADSFALAIRTWKIDSVHVLHQNRPIVQASRPVRTGGLAEYMTGLAHLNGTVDVIFDPKNSDPDRFGGDSAAFHPKEETCSAVACHPTDNPYRFAAPRKGLPGLQ